MLQEKKKNRPRKGRSGKEGWGEHRWQQGNGAGTEKKKKPFKADVGKNRLFRSVAT